MSTDVQPEFPKKKPSVLWWVAGVLFLLIALFFFQLFGPNPPVIVSKQTTYITDSLAADGLPDYEAHILEMYRDGVTPENNAAVLLFQALWPGDFETKDFQAISDELGLARIPSKDDAIEPLYGKANREAVVDWLVQQGINGAHAEMADTTIGRATDSPWTSADLPPLAEWVRDNEVQIDMIVAATGRPRFYVPSPSLINDEPDMLIAMLLPGLPSTRDAARILSVRAMWHTGEGRTEEAWRDLLALHRLAHLVEQGHTLVDKLIAFAIKGMAIKGTLALLDRGPLTVDQAKEIQRDLRTFPHFNGVAASLDRMERLSCLDGVIYFARDPSATMDSVIGSEGGFPVLNFISMDWNGVLREVNQWYDRLVAIAMLPAWPDREKAFKRFESDLDDLSGEMTRPRRWIGGVLARQQRSDIVASIMLNLFMPALQACNTVQDRINTQIDLLNLAAALAVYHAEHGQYPERLDELAPDILPNLPVDLFHAQPPVYRPIDRGYLLYSIGGNNLDDGGSNELMDVLEGVNLNDLEPDDFHELSEKIPKGSDDFSIRVPTPPFELPKPATSDEANEL